MEQYGAIRTVLTPYSSVLFYLFVGAQMQVYRPYRSPCQKCTARVHPPLSAFMNMLDSLPDVSVLDNSHPISNKNIWDRSHSLRAAA